MEEMLINPSNDNGGSQDGAIIKNDSQYICE